MLLENIKKKCIDQGISISTLEQLSGIGKNTIYKWGRSTPTVDKVKSVANCLSCSVDDLLKDDRASA